MPPRFVPRERKHKRLAKQREGKQQHEAPQNEGNRGDTNALQLPSAKDRERDGRRQELHAELRPEAKMSSKKRKRLDKYIDTKMRREENRELVKKLEASQVDTSLFQSSKKLGRVSENRRERLQRALNERAAGIADGEEILFQERLQPNGDVESDTDETYGHEDDTTEPTSTSHIDHATESSKPEFGIGLKRPFELDESGRPILQKRKRRKKMRSSIQVPEPLEDTSGTSDDGSSIQQDEEEWEGFGSDSGATRQEETAEEDNDVDPSESSSEADGEATPSENDEEKTERVSAFKQWATSQRNVAVGFQPSSALEDTSALAAKFKPRALSPDLQAPELTSATKAARPAGVISIPRTSEVQAARLELPVVQEEQKIMEAVHNNPVVVVCGATGSGKTTQIPQMLFENGYGSRIGQKSPPKEQLNGSVLQSYGMIGITQPRRVAATSVADRVGQELGVEYAKRVAHQVRYDSNVSRETAIKFMTDGILLREIQSDFILAKYSAIVVDEAHERSVNTDILIGMLSRIVSLRQVLADEDPSKHCPLKLVIMSATLRINDFLANERLFKDGPPPVVEAEGRQYPVTVHFSRRTRREYVEEMVEKVSKGHRKLPPGGILVFLTGQQEIQAVAKRLRERLGGSMAGHHTNGNSHRTDDLPLEMDDYEDTHDTTRPSDYLEGEEDNDSNSDAEVDALDENEDEFAVEEDPAAPRTKLPLKPHILPLYAALPAAQQLRVFKPPPDGHRVIILATNVAETSLTIPGIRYVFDCGRSKEKKCDSSNVQTFEIDWISKASALQRTGRAGRTGPGHCYRLYSSAVFESYFDEHTVPEILRTPLESTVLQLKAMDIDNVVNFPFPTPPDRAQLGQAERLLKNLGAISETTGKITDRGRSLARFPLSPRYGVMLLLAERNGIVDKTVALVAGLAVGDLFVPEMQSNKPVTERNENASSSEDEVSAEVDTAAAQRHQAYTRAQATLSRWDDQSDAVKLLTTVASHAETINKPLKSRSQFCEDFFLREKGMQEVQQLRHQLHSIVTSHLRTHPGGSASAAFKPQLSLPSEKERAMLNQITAAGFIDQIAIRSDLLPSSASASSSISGTTTPRRAIDVPYSTLLPTTSSSDETTEVFIHPTSVLARLSAKETPAYIIYSHLSRAAGNSVSAATNTKKTRLHALTTVGPKSLATLAEGTPLLGFGKPVGKIEQVDNGGGGGGGKRRQCWVGVFLRAPLSGGGGGGGEWPLGAWKVVQKKDSKGEWKVEKVLTR